MPQGRHTTRYLRPGAWRARQVARALVPLTVVALSGADPTRTAARPPPIPRGHPSVAWRPPHGRVVQTDPIRHDRMAAIKAADEARRNRARERAAAARRRAEHRRRVAARQRAHALALARANAEEARRRARQATRRAPRAIVAGHSSTSGTTSGKAAAVLARARTLLGRPYCSGGTGYCLDCSGFTLLAYRAAGLSLPHYSGAQPGYGHRVSVPRPGDLGWHPGHVVIYYGNGRIIGAHRPGVASNISSIYGSFTWYRMW
jgi:cell wall-associated NlpC family hydrolase